jgi:hypothetical protein
MSPGTFAGALGSGMISPLAVFRLRSSSAFLLIASIRRCVHRRAQRGGGGKGDSQCSVTCKTMQAHGKTTCLNVSLTFWGGAPVALLSRAACAPHDYQVREPRPHEAFRWCRRAKVWSPQPRSKGSCGENPSQTAGLSADVSQFP